MALLEEPILVELKKFKDPDGQERVGAVASMADALVIPNLKERIQTVEQKYQGLVLRCLAILNDSKRLRASARPRWKIGNEVVSFQKSKKEGIYVCNIVEALSRDIGISKTQLNYILRFRRAYPKEEELNSRINWSKYRELMDFPDEKSRKKCEKLILSGRIKTDSEIRTFKKSLGLSC